MIDRGHALPVTRQAQVLQISRGSVYYQPRPVSAADLAIMRQIDALHLDYPFAGSRMLRDLLGRTGVSVGRRHVVSLMKRMGIEAIYRRPRTSKPGPGHKIYPYLLRDVTVGQPDQVWCTDITYSAPRPGWSGERLTGMLRRKEETEESLALCCEGA
jgi:putative transposase